MSNGCPSYPPELNPTEQVWNHVKYSELPNATLDDIEALAGLVGGSLLRQNSRSCCDPSSARPGCGSETRSFHYLCNDQESRSSASPPFAGFALSSDNPKHWRLATYARASESVTHTTAPLAARYSKRGRELRSQIACSRVGPLFTNEAVPRYESSVIPRRESWRMGLITLFRHLREGGQIPCHHNVVADSRRLAHADPGSHPRPFRTG